MLSKPRKLSKEEKKKLIEEFKEIQKNSKFELWDNDLSVSSWDFVLYMVKYKSKN